MKKIYTLFLVTLISISVSYGQIQKVVASDRAYGYFFGEAVAIDGDYAVAGSRYADGQEGAAYIFEKNEQGEFIEMAKLKAEGPFAGAWMGYAVAIYGNTAVVGAPLEAYDEVGANYKTEAGAIYIFTRGAGGVWSEWQKVVPPDRDYLANFGYSVAIHNQHIIVGARGEKKDENGLNPIDEAGAAYILTEEDGLWTVTEKIVASDRTEDDWFGEDVAIYGNTAVVGVPWEDEDLEGGNALDRAGKVYVYQIGMDDNWQEYQRIVQDDREQWDQFGFSVDIREDRLAIGSNFKDKPGTENIIDAGAVYMYEKDNTGIWQFTEKLFSEDAYYFDEFGYSVSIHGDHLLVGAYSSDDYGSGTQEIFNAGAAYYFEYNNGSWNQINKIVAPVRAEADIFGVDVGINADGVGIIGAMREDEDQNEQNTISDAGAAYFWKSGTSSITENAFPGELSVYPNPVTEGLNIHLDTPYNLQIQVSDISGRQVFKQNYNSTSTVSLDLREFRNGVYFIRIQSEEYFMIEKVIRH